MIWPLRTDSLGKVFSLLFAEKMLILALRARFIFVCSDSFGFYHGTYGDCQEEEESRTKRWRSQRDRP